MFIDLPSYVRKGHNEHEMFRSQIFADQDKFLEIRTLSKCSVQNFVFRIDADFFRGKSCYSTNQNEVKLNWTKLQLGGMI